MHPSLEAFALAAGLLALSAALVHRFGFPPLPVYLLTGLVVGERLPVEDLEPLPSLGLLLLLFFVGLEFGPDRLRDLSEKALRAGFFDALALPLGFLLGLLAGLDLRGALLLTAVIYNTSSVVIAKLIIDLRRAANPESEVVLGVTLLEDLVTALLLALLGGQGPAGFLGGGGPGPGLLPFRPLPGPEARPLHGKAFRRAGPPSRGLLHRGHRPPLPRRGGLGGGGGLPLRGHRRGAWPQGEA